MTYRLLCLCAFLGLMTASLPTMATPIHDANDTVVKPDQVAPNEINETNIPVPPPDCPTMFIDLYGKPIHIIDRKRFEHYPLRILRPNQAVTRDHMDGRVNLHLDGRDNIIGITCG